MCGVLPSLFHMPSWSAQEQIYVLVLQIVGRDSVAGIATRYTLNGPGIESQ
jgi:hypothetical protein